MKAQYKFVVVAVDSGLDVQLQSSAHVTITVQEYIYVILKSAKTMSKSGSFKVYAADDPFS